MGIVLAGVPNSPIRRLVINDIAPEVPTAALQRLALYLGADRRFPDLRPSKRICARRSRPSAR